MIVIPCCGREIGDAACCRTIEPGGWSGRRLTPDQLARNREIRPVRAAVERVFAVMKQWYGYRRVRYRSLLRNSLQLQLLCAAMNLRHALVLGA